jgi:hypothetical protein
VTIWWHLGTKSGLNQDRRIVTLMMSVLWTYLVSQMFDSFTWNEIMPKAMANVFEENLEAFGHLLLLAQVAVPSTVLSAEGSTLRWAPSPAATLPTMLCLKMLLKNNQDPDARGNHARA